VHAPVAQQRAVAAELRRERAEHRLEHRAAVDGQRGPPVRGS